MKKQQLYKCVVIDDEPEARFIMKHLLEQIPEAEHSFAAADAQSGLAAIAKLHPDIVFLDIEMPDISGMDLAAELNKQNIQTHIVFVTAYDKYAIAAIKLADFDYLLKPVDPVQLQAVFDKLNKKERQEAILNEKLDMLLHQLQHPNRLRFNSRTGFLVIEPSEIIMVKADGNYSELQLTDNRKETLTVNMGHVEEMLDRKLFFKASRSLLINLQYVRRLDRKTRKLILKHKETSYEVCIARDQIAALERVWE